MLPLTLCCLCFLEQGDGPYLDFPHYFDGKLQPVGVEKVPPELAQQKFPLVRKTGSFAHFKFKQAWSFYQDRLGTYIGKHSKKTHFLVSGSNHPYP